MEAYRREQKAKLRWKILRHVIFAALRFLSPKRRRSMSSAAKQLSDFSSIISEADASLLSYDWGSSQHISGISSDLSVFFNSSFPFDPTGSPMDQFEAFDDQFEAFDYQFEAFDNQFEASEVLNPCDKSSALGALPPQSRWRIVKVVIRFMSAIRRNRRKAAVAVAFPYLELKSIIAAADKTYKVVHRQTGETYALKEILNDSTQRQHISREIQILKELDHPNLVKCYDAYLDADDSLIFLLLEPLDLGSLSVTTESDLATIARQLLLGLTYLHRNRISHGDIKPSNIFINHAGQLKLLFLGNTLSKTPPLSAEIGAVHDGFSWDVWSVGLFILKLSKGLNWFDTYARFNENAIDLKPVVQKQPLKLDLGLSDMDEDIVPSSSHLSMELLRFLSSCMQTDVLKRWTAEQLVNHPFLNQLPLKKPDVEIPQLKKENELFHDKEELTSHVNKKSKIAMEDEDRVYDLESSKHPTTKVLPHGVPERCIEHCKLFLPDCEFEKDKLVQMWIAEDCIELGVIKRMEDVGNLYFDALVQAEVIVPSKFDILHRQMKYKFITSHVSDGLLKRGNYLRINASNLDEIYYGEALHLSWQCKRLDRTFFDALKNFKQLHTLVVHEDDSVSINQLPNDIFVGLRLLKTLDMSRTRIEEVPGSIGKLESLRYLDISETPIKQLPESLGRLYCLQTLNLKACFGFAALP